MNIENEYWTFKKQLKNEMETFKHFKYDLDIIKMSEEQLDARNRGLKSSEKSVNETSEILEEIKVELYDYIYNGGEVSKETIETLSIDLHQDIFFKGEELDEYDKEVLNGKVEFLESLI